MSDLVRELRELAKVWTAAFHGRADILTEAANEIASLKAEVERLKDGHCLDCCCARAWKALGITENTGRSIPEEIELRQAVVNAARSYLSHPVIDGMAVDYWDYKRLQEAVRALDGEP